MASARFAVSVVQSVPPLKSCRAPWPFGTCKMWAFAVANEIDHDGMSVVAKIAFVSGRIALRLLLLRYSGKSSIKAPGHIA